MLFSKLLGVMQAVHSPVEQWSGGIAESHQIFSWSTACRFSEEFVIEVKMWVPANSFLTCCKLPSNLLPLPETSGWFLIFWHSNTFLIKIIKLLKRLIAFLIKKNVYCFKSYVFLPSWVFIDLLRFFQGFLEISLSFIISKIYNVHCMNRLNWSLWYILIL